MEHSADRSEHLTVSMGVQQPQVLRTDGTAASQHFAPRQEHLSSSDICLSSRMISPVRWSLV